jgi:hypothetical protein
MFSTRHPSTVRIGLQFVHSGHAQHRSVGIKDQRKRLLIGHKPEPEYAFIKRTRFCGIGGGSERDQLLIAKN